MPTTLKYLLWSILSTGLIFVAIMAFWVFLIVIGLIIIGRLIYLNFFNKGTRYSGRIFTYTIKKDPVARGSEQKNEEYTTVIDADNMEKEYKIPKIK